MLYWGISGQPGARGSGHEGAAVVGSIDRQSRNGARTPVQQRSRHTVEKILDAAAEVLAVDGMPSFTTNAVALQAGVNIATLYAYFPDKGALLVALAERNEAARAAFMAERLEGLRSIDWREWLEMTLAAMADFRVAHPGDITLRRALTSTPEFRDIDAGSTERIAEGAVRFLQRTNPDLPADMAARIAQVTVLASIEVLDLACSSGQVDRALLGELVDMLTSYLGPHLGGRGSG